jgi:hypothetical protein
VITDEMFKFSLRGEIIEADRSRVIGKRLCIRPGECRIRIFQENDPEMESPRVFVLATDLGDENTGPAITVAVADIANQICLGFDIDPYALVFIEHHDDRAINHRGEHKGEEKFCLVHMLWNGARFINARWQQMEKVEVEAAIGEQLP